LEFFQQEVVEAFPDPGLLPSLEGLLAGLATTPAQLGRQVLSVDADFEDEGDACKELAIVQRPSR
jgi:hypothetical protein